MTQIISIHPESISSRGRDVPSVPLPILHRGAEGLPNSHHAKRMCGPLVSSPRQPKHDVVMEAAGGEQLLVLPGGPNVLLLLFVPG